jgi:large repetitive protein
MHTLLHQTKLIIIAALLLVTYNAAGQCGPGTPTMIANLTGAPDSVWVSPLVQRADNCCGTTPPDKCVKFIITLDPAAQGITFSIASGAVPPGALFYQINCGPPVAVGAAICLNGVGPHILTFCKPGNNQNTYMITSIPAPTAGSDVVVNDGCSIGLSVTGFDPATITWNSISPGATGAFNSYLSCTSGCTSPTVTPAVGAPASVSYLVCGQAAAACNPQIICDTVTVTINPTLGVNITPLNPTVCFGQTTTTITAIGTGGTPPYSFLWSTGATTPGITIGAGTYSVVMQDASDCPPVSTSVTVTAFANPITANAGPDLFMCPTASSVTLAGSVTGVTTGIWSGGAGSFVPNNTTLNATYTPTPAEIAGGSINLTLTTTNNGTCPGASDIVTVNFVTASLAFVNTPVSCFGGTNGTATVNVTGTFAPVSFSWNSSPVQTSQTATGLPAGTYTVIVTLAGGCTVTGNTTVTEPTQLTGSLSVTPVTCNGSCNGAVTVNASGGTPTLQYSLNGGAFQSSNSYTALCNGALTVIVRDGNNCTLTLNGSITQPPALTVSVTGTTPATCGNNNGTITVAGSGGVPAYQFSNGGAFQPGTTFTGLAPGNYTITVKDNNNCTSTISATVTASPSPVLAVQSQSNLNCFGSSNGSVLLGATGGAAPLNYSIAGPVNAGPQLSNLFNTLTFGSYTATVVDANGCIGTTTFTITQPTQLTYGTNPTTMVTCNGLCDGSITFSPAGGTPTYEFSSDNGLTFTTSNPITGLCAGNINVVVRDANGCLANSVVVITQPAVLSATFVNVNPVCNGSCDGQITVNATGGTTSYQYSVDGGPFQASNIFTGLCSGSHLIVVEDANGCTFTSTQNLVDPPGMTINLVSVTSSNCGFNDGAFEVSASGPNAIATYETPPSFGPQPTGVFNNVSGGGYTTIVTDVLGCTDSIFVAVNDVQMSAALISLTDATCFGVCDGSVVCTNTSGLAPYTFELNNQGITQPTGTFNGLCAGNQIVTVYDAGFCVASILFTISEPTEITFSTTQVDVTCNGAATGQIAFINTTGGTGAHEFSVSGSGGPYQASPNFVGLTAGLYNLAVRDANGCIVTGSVTLTEPTPLTFVVNSSDLLCFSDNSGFLQIVGAGATPPYQVAATGPVNFPMSPMFTFINIPAGIYNFTVQDAFGCQAIGSATINQPAALTSTYTPSATSCSGSCDGTIQVNASGGTPVYLYSADNGVTFFVSSLLTGLCSGAHSIVIKDDNNCTLTASQNITQPTPVTLSATSTSATCSVSNGTITLSGGGGVGGYQYSVNNGATFVPGNLFSGLASGLYNLAVKDANGCTDTDTISINNEPAPIIITTNTTPPSCFNGCNGTAAVVATGGTGALQYSIGGPNQASPSFTGLCPGNYSITITDTNGCQDVETFIITNPTPVAISTASTDLLCFQNATGTITLTGSGGAGGYQYSINNGVSFQGGSLFPGLQIGTYTVLTQDANGCQASSSVTLNEPPALTVTLSSVNDPTCTGFGNGFITAQPGGGTPSYTFAWNTAPVQTNATATGLQGGFYSVTVTDLNGCTADTSAILIDPPPVQTFISPTDTICLGQTTTLIATATGGNGSYTFGWTPSLGTSGTQVIAPVVTSTFSVTAFDNFGCPGNTVSVQIVVYNLPGANLTVNALTPICPGSSTLVYANVVGAQGPLTYSWNNGLGPGPGGFLVTPSAPTTYAVTVTNSCGATASAQVDVTFNPPPVITIDTDTAVGCAAFSVNFYDLSTTVPNDSIFSWQWDFGDGGTSTLDNPIHTYGTPGLYNVTLSVITYAGCTNNNASSPYSITVYPQPIAAFSTNTTTVDLPYDEVVCTNQSAGALSYIWNFGDGVTSTQTNPPSHLYPTIGTWTISLVAFNQFGCTDTAFNNIIATSDIVFPNAFTPNTSGSNGGTFSYEDLDNDVFYPFTSGVNDYHLMIFNRWGELIFESFELQIGWDGYYRDVICPQDVYVWKAEVSFIDGRKFNETGNVTLLR